MDPYSNSYTSDDQDEEPYHSAPAYDEEDIVCLGSDSEETTEEIARKRQRYEAEALRCIQGKLPILQSASLKGPFDAGWVNPWRYRPKKKKNEDWWQPGSEDMLFTRARVMERAAAHGLGYLQPADALKWCKAAAQAEAEAIDETNIQTGQIMRSVERDEFEDSEEMDDTPEIDDGHQITLDHASARNQKDPEISMLNNHSKTPHENESRGSTKITKRPAESQWLKGSYVSKRARWEGPAVPSPTPHPDVVDRDRRRRQLSAKSFDQGRVGTRKPSRLSKSFLNHESKKDRRYHLATLRNPVTPQDLRKQSDHGVISTFGRDGKTSQLGPEDFGHQPDDFDELQDNSQEELFRAGPQSSVKSKKFCAPPVDHRSFSDLEPDDLIVITPRTKPNTSASFNKSRKSDAHMSNTALDDSYDLPQLPRQNVISQRDNAGEGYEDEDSFVTEVAPSSRNLEKFYFRKRKPRFTQLVEIEQDREEVEKRHSEPSDALSQHSEGQYIPPETMQTTEEALPHPNASTQEQVNSMRAPSADERPKTDSQTTPPKSNKSGSCWDLADDILPSASFTRTTIAHQTTSPPKSTSSTSASPFATPKKIAKPSLVTSITNHLLKSFRKSGKFETATKDLRLPPCSNEMSTQSFNTTPPGSMISPERKSLPQMQGSATQHSKSEASPGKLVISEMSQIQLALSQVCPSISRADSTHTTLDKALHPSAVKDGLSAGSRGPQLHLPGGSPLNSIAQLQSHTGLASGLPDMEFAPFMNESFLFLGDYLADPANTIDTVALAGTCAITSPAVVRKDRLQESSNEPQGVSVGPEPAQDRECTPQVGIKVASEAAVVLEHESQLSVKATSKAPIVLEQDFRLSADGTPNRLDTAQLVDEDGHGDFNGLRTTYEGGLVNKDAADRPCPVPEDDSQPSDHDSIQDLDDEPLSERDEGSMNQTETHHNIDPLSNEIGSGPAMSPGTQARLSPNADIQDVQDEADDDDLSKDVTKMSDKIDQDNLERHPGSVAILNDTAAAVRPHGHRDEPAPDSESSWGGCGPQSPWAAEKIDPLPTFILSRRVTEDSPQHTKHNECYNAESVEPHNVVANEDMSCVTIHRPSTPDYGGIKPFADFSTPTASPERRPAGMETQSLADIAMQNPWSSNSKNRSSVKPIKRVSFGIMPFDENSPLVEARSVNNPLSPPPAQIKTVDQVDDEDIFHDRTTVTTNFNKHFVAATGPRLFKRILPEARASQLHSSPAKLEAQAEAFIAADHGIANEQASNQWPTSAQSTSSRRLKARSDSNTNSVWNEGEGEDEDSILSNPFSRSPLEGASGRPISLATFDMASALVEAAGFLEDWSVDSVLKPAKEKEKASANLAENNGIKRRKLFGLV